MRDGYTPTREYEVNISTVRKFDTHPMRFSTLVARWNGGLYTLAKTGKEDTFHVFCEFYDVGLGMTGPEIECSCLEDMSFKSYNFSSLVL